MILSRQTISLLVTVLVGLLGSAVAAKEPPSASPVAASNATLLPWLSSLQQGERQATAKGRPLLVRIGAAWCPVCRNLETEIAKREVQVELARWVLVYVNADTQVAEVDNLNVAVVPTLQLRTPDGKVVAMRQGAINAEALLEWLKKNRQTAAALPDTTIASASKPDATALMRLLHDMEDRSATVRETAIRRLLRYPEESREAVIKVFCQGSLAAKLSAMDLLQAWQAPLDGVDPWVPDTMTPERLASLVKWRDQPLPKPAEDAAKFTPQELAAAAEQIDRMLKGSEEEADAIRQRLARFGVDLMPQVYARLKDTASDEQHQRLLALRYRLVADDVLALRWPGGLMRLAASDSRQRQQAADELAAAATPADQPLLLELFSDPDPLVREICLRGLQHMGGKESTCALVKLLADPEPNVRAAVLKQLEADPQPGMAGKVAEYLEKETDPDLLVHGIRFLSKMSGRQTVKCLVKLLKHDSWQVRAEAAASVTKGLESGGYRPSGTRDRSADGEDEAENFKADTYIALIEMLEDSDSFVVSKAVEGLAHADMPMAIEPMVKAAQRHPDLALSIVAALTRGQTIRGKAVPHLRKFCKHADERIRAAAIRGLVESAPDDASSEILVLLSDGSANARTAAAQAMWEILGEKPMSRAEDSFNSRSSIGLGSRLSLSGGEGVVSTAMNLLSGILGKAKTPVAEKEPAAEAEPAADEQSADSSAAKPEDSAENPAAERGDLWDNWLTTYYASRGGQRWAEQAMPLLEKMLAAENKDERLAAAKVLVPVGKFEKSLAVLLEAVRANPDAVADAAEVLPWLVATERLRFFHDLLKIPSKNEQHRAILVRALAAAPDPRMAEPLWDLLADANMTVELAAHIEGALRRAYLGKDYYNLDELGPAALKRIAAPVRARLTSPGPWQRFVAMALAAKLGQDGVAETAVAMADDAAVDAKLRRMAFQMTLFAEADAAKRTAMAVAAIAGADADRRKIALAILVEGRYKPENVADLFDVKVPGGRESRYQYGSSQPIIPEPPKGLKPAHILPLAKDDNPQIAAYAGYLLALMEDASGIDSLIRYYQASNKKDEDHLARLVYRAVAVLDDPKHIGVLRSIYASLSEYEISDFYWTIRIMSGSEILQLRKEIRDKYSDRLR